MKLSDFILKRDCPHPETEICCNGRDCACLGLPIDPDDAYYCLKCNGTGTQTRELSAEDVVECLKCDRGRYEHVDKFGRGSFSKCSCNGTSKQLTPELLAAGWRLVKK